MIKKRNLIFFILFILPAIFLSLRVVIDPDLGWHLQVGKFIRETKQVPYRDLFSFSMPDYPYVYHSWLTELFLYLFYRQFGLWGVSFFYATITAAGFWFIAETSRLRLKKKLFFFSILFFISLGIVIVQSRTQVTTFLGMSLLYYLFSLFNFKERSRLNALWLIPFLFVFWVNSHGGFLLGLFFLFLLIALKSIEIFNADRLFSEKKQSLGFLVLIAGFSFLATLINPYGLRAYQEAFLIGTNAFNMANNLDWAPLFTNNFPILNSQLLFVAGVIYLIFFFVLFSGRKTNWQEKLLIGLFFLLSLKTRRYVLPLFVVLLPPLLLEIEFLFEKYKPILRKEKLLSGLPVYLGLFAGITVLFAGQLIVVWKMRRAYSFEEEYARQSKPFLAYPYKAVLYMKEKGVPERMLNYFTWGGYLIWHFPDQKFFIDGRMDSFYLQNGLPLTADYWQIIQAQPEWERLIDQYQIQSVFLPKSLPVVQILKQQKKWEVLYEDEQNIIFRKRVSS